jgi:hypothetical protein
MGLCPLGLDPLVGFSGLFLEKLDLFIGRLPALGFMINQNIENKITF